MNVNAETFKQDCIQIMENIGLSKEDASVVTDSILYAHQRGKHTHGIGRIPIYKRKIEENLMNPVSRMEVIRETPVTALIDADNGFGQIAGIDAMDLAVGKAKEHGIGLVLVRDSNNFGTAGFIGEYAADNDMIGIILANSAPAIAPDGSAEPIFGTNPLCFSFPTESGFPIIFDMACSNAARGKIRLALKNGEKIPEGWAVDENGKPTTDPAKALKGTMMAIGGYKGFGLSMAVDILAGLLSGSAFGGEVKNLNHPTEKSRYGHFVMAINPAFFMDMNEYYQNIQTLIENVKACRFESEIILPGEKSWKLAQKQSEEIEIPDKLYAEFIQLKNSQENPV